MQENLFFGWFELVLTRFWTTWPYLQQIYLTWAHDSFENQPLVGGQIKKKPVA